MSHTAANSRNVRVPVLTVMAVSTLGVILYSCGAFFAHIEPHTDSVISNFGLIWLNAAVFLLSLMLAFRKGYERRLQRAWLLVGLSGLSNVIAEALWFYYETILKIDPFPSLADLFYLLYYPLLFAGLLFFPFAPITSQERRTFILDMAIIMSTCLILLWFLILGPISLASERGLAGIVSGAYPVGDLLILGGVTALIQRDLERVSLRVLSLLALGLVFLAFSDILFSYYEYNQVEYRMSFLNLGWWMAALAHVCAAGWQLISGPAAIAGPDLRFSRSRHLLRLALPYLAVAGGVGLLVVVFNTQLVWNTRLSGLFHGTVVLIILVLYRQYVVLRENVSLYEEMKRLASTDSLTGLYNRHFFNERFPGELKRAARYQRALGVLLVDIDGFKKINDALGHLKGDQVLKVVAQALAAQLRASDLLARFGGDEFVVLLPETEEAAARLVAERLKKAVVAQRFAGIQLGVSIGLTTARPDASPEQLLEEADRDLYHQKGIDL